jgi:hypothetical protein
MCQTEQNDTTNNQPPLVVTLTARMCNDEFGNECENNASVPFIKLRRKPPFQTRRSGDVGKDTIRCGLGLSVEDRILQASSAYPCPVLRPAESPPCSTAANGQNPSNFRMRYLVLICGRCIQPALARQGALQGVERPIETGMRARCLRTALSCTFVRPLEYCRAGFVS